MLTTHSGLHPGGVPLKSGRQEQVVWPFTLAHLLFGPQGEGSQGFVGLVAAIVMDILRYRYQIILYINGEYFLKSAVGKTHGVV